jgi:hypothetical protein
MTDRTRRPPQRLRYYKPPPEPIASPNGDFQVAVRDMPASTPSEARGELADPDHDGIIKVPGQPSPPRADRKPRRSA